jgi:hypothetical protein
VQQTIINEIINQARNTYHLGDADVANLLSIAKLESGFNPDAAAKSILRPGDSADKETSAAGVFQVTDSTAADASKRLSNTKTDNNVTLGSYDRFNYVSNIQYGIAVYLDKKRVAKSSDVFNIYKAWNSNPNEYNRYQTSLRNDEITYAQELATASANPGTAEPAATDTLNTDKVYVYAPQGYLTLAQELQLQPNIMDPAVKEVMSFDHFTQELQNTTRTVQNPDGSTYIEFIGNGSLTNVNNAHVTVDDNSDVEITGASTVNVGSSSEVEIDSGGVSLVVQGNNSTLTINGANDTTSVSGANDLTVVNGSNDITQNYGAGDVTDNYGTSDSTYNYGSDEHNFNYGSYDFAWSNNSTDTNYNSNSTDDGGGDGSYGYGGWEPGEGYFGYGGTAKGKNGSGVNIDALVKFDKDHGKDAAAALVSQAKSQINTAIAENSAVVSIGAKWDKKVVTWSLANAGGEFTHRLSADEEKAVQRALDQWTEATGVIFKEVQQPAKADMVFGLGDLDTAESGVLGLAAIKKNDGVISRAIITLEDPALSSVVQSGSGEELYANSDAGFDQVLLHEIGHAVGFGDNIDPSSIENFDLTAANRTLSDADISSAAALYGKTASTGAEIHSAKAVDELVHAMSSFAAAQVQSNVLSFSDAHHLTGTITVGSRNLHQFAR